MEKTSAQHISNMIGTVKNLNGKVNATDPNGVTRILKAGDRVYPGETLQAEKGVSAHIDFGADGFVTLGGNALTLDQALLAQVAEAAAAQSAEPLSAADIEALQVQIEAGEDPTAVAEAAAAGQQAGSSSQEGSGFVVVQQNAARGEVTPSFETDGMSESIVLPVSDADLYEVMQSEALTPAEVESPPANNGNEPRPTAIEWMENQQQADQNSADGSLDLKAFVEEGADEGISITGWALDDSDATMHVIARLVDAGLIEDADGFVRYLKERFTLGEDGRLSFTDAAGFNTDAAGNPVATSGDARTIFDLMGGKHTATGSDGQTVTVREGDAIKGSLTLEVDGKEVVIDFSIKGTDDGCYFDAAHPFTHTNASLTLSTNKQLVGVYKAEGELNLADIDDPTSETGFMIYHQTDENRGEWVKGSYNAADNTWTFGVKEGQEGFEGEGLRYGKLVLSWDERAGKWTYEYTIPQSITDAGNTVFEPINIRAYDPDIYQHGASPNPDTYSDAGFMFTIDTRALNTRGPNAVVDMVELDLGKGESGKVINDGLAGETAGRIGGVLANDADQHGAIGGKSEVLNALAKTGYTDLGIWKIDASGEFTYTLWSDAAAKSLAVEYNLGLGAAELDQKMANAGARLAELNGDGLVAGGYTIDSIRYEVTDGNVTNDGYIHVTIMGANDAPVVHSVQTSISAINQGAIDLGVKVQDPDMGDDHTFRIFGDNTGTALEAVSADNANSEFVIPDGYRVGKEYQTNASGNIHTDATQGFGEKATYYRTTHGWVVDDGQGNLKYVVNNADPAVIAARAKDQPLTDEFWYSAHDGTDESVPQKITVSINGYDDAYISRPFEDDDLRQHSYKNDDTKQIGNPDESGSQPDLVSGKGGHFDVVAFDENGRLVQGGESWLVSAGSHMQRYIGDMANNIQSLEGLAAGDASIRQNIACSFDANDTFAQAKALRNENRSIYIEVQEGDETYLVKVGNLWIYNQTQLHYIMDMDNNFIDMWKVAGDGKIYFAASQPSEKDGADRINITDNPAEKEDIVVYAISDSKGADGRNVSIEVPVDLEIHLDDDKPYIKSAHHDQTDAADGVFVGEIRYHDWDTDANALSMEVYAKDPQTGEMTWQKIEPGRQYELEHGQITFGERADAPTGKETTSRMPYTYEPNEDVSEIVNVEVRVTDQDDGSTALGEKDYSNGTISIAVGVDTPEGQTAPDTAQYMESGKLVDYVRNANAAVLEGNVLTNDQANDISYDKVLNPGIYNAPDKVTSVTFPGGEKAAGEYTITMHLGSNVKVHEASLLIDESGNFSVNVPGGLYVTVQGPDGKVDTWTITGRNYDTIKEMWMDKYGAEPQLTYEFEYQVKGADNVVRTEHIVLDYTDYAIPMAVSWNGGNPSVWTFDVNTLQNQKKLTATDTNPGEIWKTEIGFFETTGKIVNGKPQFETSYETGLKDPLANYDTPDHKLAGQSFTTDLYGIINGQVVKVGEVEFSDLYYNSVTQLSVTQLLGTHSIINLSDEFRAMLTALAEDQTEVMAWFKIAYKDATGIYSNGVIDVSFTGKDIFAANTSLTVSEGNLTGEILDVFSGAKHTVGADRTSADGWNTDALADIEGKYGKLVWNGENYEYRLYTAEENATAYHQVKSMWAGDALKETLNYTLTDKNGETKNLQASVTINGENSGVVGMQTDTISLSEANGTYEGRLSVVAEDKGVLSYQIKVFDVDLGKEVILSANGATAKTAYGELTFFTNGSYTFRPNGSLQEGESGQLDFQYKGILTNGDKTQNANPAEGWTDVSMDITGVNDAPYIIFKAYGYEALSDEMAVSTAKGSILYADVDDDVGTSGHWFGIEADTGDNAREISSYVNEAGDIVYVMNGETGSFELNSKTGHYTFHGSDDGAGGRTSELFKVFVDDGHGADGAANHQSDPVEFTFHTVDGKTWYGDQFDNTNDLIVVDNERSNIVIGGKGNDIIDLGNSKDNILVWRAEDVNKASDVEGDASLRFSDIIKGFDIKGADGESGDILDLRDLLSSAERTGSLDEILSYHVEDNNTIIDVKIDGQTSVQSIVLEDVQLELVNPNQNGMGSFEELANQVNILF